MKTIIYILIAVMIGSIVYSAIPQSNKNVQVYKNEIVLESNNKVLFDSELQYSVNIISKRLEDYGIKLFSIYPVVDKSQIHINFKKQQNVVEIADLLCQIGKLHFLETYSSAEVTAQLQQKDKLYALMNVEKSEYYTAELGTCTLADAEKLSDYLNSGAFRKKIPANLLFAWSKVSAEKPNQLSIFCLKLDNEDISVLDGNAVAEIKLDISDSKNPAILIKFNEQGAKFWQKMTAENINKTIAIVMDQQVYYAPVVKSEIKGGNCSLTGKFSEKEVKVFVSLVKNGELPTSFKIK
ncbi:MAG: hypothetical protein P1P88_06645 [Bacteroidales bacterium]|nr:hypothetical protein [Bacteroidales bacterium]